MNLILELEATEDLARVDLKVLQLLDYPSIIGILLTDGAELINKTKVF